MLKNIFAGKKILVLVILASLFVVGAVLLGLLINQPKTKTTVSKPTATSSSKPNKKQEPAVPKLSLESIFAAEPASLTGLDENKIIKIIATGDVIPARGANWPAVKSGNFKVNWEKTADYLKSGDLTLINLETSLFAGCPLQTSGFTFCGDARQVEGIVWSGVDVASLANNHIGNYGSTGINKTIKLLADNSVEYCGFDHLATKEVKGIKFGFLGYNGIGTTIDRESVAAQIAQSKKTVDILIVSIHWGKEYESFPQPDGKIAPDDPKEIAKMVIDSGADLIIGNHPHTVQGVQIMNTGFVTYAHGNFIFDQTWSEETKEGVVGEYTFYDKKLIAVYFKPTKYDGQYQPRFLDPNKEGAQILKRMQDSSTQLAK